MITETVDLSIKLVIFLQSRRFKTSVVFSVRLVGSDGYRNLHITERTAAEWLLNTWKGAREILNLNEPLAIRPSSFIQIPQRPRSYSLESVAPENYRTSYQAAQVDSFCQIETGRKSFQFSPQKLFLLNFAQKNPGKHQYTGYKVGNRENRKLLATY